MPTIKKRVSLIIFVIATLLLVGLVPLVLTGWFLSDKSGRELRSAENRYQIQLVQEKARQIEMFGRRWTSIVSSLSTALELSHDPLVVSSAQTEAKLASILRENPDLVALYVKPANADSFSVFRAEALNRDDVENIAAEMSAVQTKAKIFAGEPRKLTASGQAIMSFATRVNIDGVKAADIVAVASLQSISQSVVGINSTK
ncbi:MAG: PDC sensor domain-containing protein [Chloracidobacterium sp.]|nr:PDC sensor domain-containing protein [Chloracidobacterium sp.]